MTNSGLQDVFIDVFSKSSYGQIAATADAYPQHSKKKHDLRKVRQLRHHYDSSLPATSTSLWTNSRASFWTNSRAFVSSTPPPHAQCAVLYLVPVLNGC